MTKGSTDPFARALRENDAAEVARLLDAGRDVAERFHFGRTALHVAAEVESVDCVDLLLLRGAPLEAHDEGGNTALICALEAGHARLAERLISAGALLHYRFSPKDTPEIRERLRRTLEKISAESREAYPEVYSLLDDASLEVERTEHDRAMAENFVAIAMRVTEIHAIHHCGNLETLQLLSRRPAVDFNLHDGAGYWPLKTFSELGDGDVVSWLLQNGASHNFTSTGDTALHAAVSGNHLECARLLLQAGANPNQQDVDGCVPMWRVASDEMLDLLLAHGADPTVGDQCGLKPSHWVEDPKLKARLLALELPN